MDTWESEPRAGPVNTLIIGAKSSPAASIVAIPLVGAYQESLGMDHNLLGSANEAHILVDDAGRPHLDKVVRGESLGQVLAGAGYDAQGLEEGIRQISKSAENQGKLTAEEREALVGSFMAALDSYTYLEE